MNFFSGFFPCVPRGRVFASLLPALPVLLASCNPWEPPVAVCVFEPEWAEKKPAYFSYTFARSCFCGSDALGPFHVRATAHAVISVYRMNSPSDSTRITEDVQSYSIDSIQADLRGRLNQNPAQAEVRCDPVYGFPAEVYIDQATGIADDEYGFAITDFRVLPPYLPD